MSRDVSKIMKRVRSRDTQPELLFRKTLWKAGVRYRVCDKDIPGKPDVTLSARKLAIFIDGEFWHGSQWMRRKLDSLEEQFKRGKSKEYWLRKIRMNMQRDCHSTATLLSQGWTVLRFWDSQIRKNLDGCIGLTLDVIHGRVQSSPFSLVPQKTFSEFFAGIGLMRIALERHGWEISSANDIDPKKYQMYAGQFKGSEEIFNLVDIHKLSAGQIPSCTLATASFPCNDLSLAGNRKGLKGKSSSAFWGFLRLLRDMDGRRPPLVLVENVMGFITSNNGTDLKDALVGLNELGYSVDIFMVDAAWFVPQSRRRLFIIAQIEGPQCEGNPTATTKIGESQFRTKKIMDFINSHGQIRWRLRELPKADAAPVNLEQLLEDLPEEASEWWDSARTQYLLNQVIPRQREMLDSIIAGDDWTYRTAFRRTRKEGSVAEIRSDGIAGCLRTPRGGSARQILVKAGKGQFFARLLTPRECARLMGVDDYCAKVSASRAFMGFGDAVCVPVIEWIALHRLNPLVTELIRGRPLSLAEGVRPHVEKKSMSYEK